MNGAGPALSASRAWNIAFRTAHIGVTGALFGGHVFAVAAKRLLPCLYLSILTGMALLLVELYPEWRRLFEVRTAMIAAKLCLLCLIPWLWAWRVAILIAVILIASIGSHMPRRYRYYSFLERRGLDAMAAADPPVPNDPSWR
ncbi:MAG: hypothetical protein ABSH56_02945 [Bryobacteraceae bacterium]|jgi:hypothetical protein